MRNPTLNVELCFSSNDTLVFFLFNRIHQQECNHSKASKAEQESNTKTNKLMQKQTNQQNITI